LKVFPEKQWSKSTVYRLLERIDRDESVKRKEGSGRPRTVCNPDTVAEVEELVLSQENAPRTHKSTREIAKETGVSQTSIRRIIHKDLQLKCFRRKQAQELSDSNKLSRLVRAKQLLKAYPKHLVQFIWFTHEKIFTVAPPLNPQNDRVYAPNHITKKQLSAERLLHTQSTFSKSIMVSVGVSALGCTDLIFIEPGVKINGQYYRDVLLAQGLLPAIRDISGEFFIFQQDGAPSHRAKETVEFLSSETPDFIKPWSWPPNSPDLNPVDYKIWGLLQERVYRSRIRNVDHLKQLLMEEWSQFDQAIIDHAVDEWRLRLQACVRANGGHFEHQMK